MKKSIGIVMVIIGALMMIYTGVNFVTEKKVADLGPVEISKEKNHPVNWSPLIGLVLLVSGVVVISTSRGR